MVSPWVVWYEDLPDVPTSLGSKGASLWSMLREGFPVPPAIALTTDAYDLWVQSGRPDHLADPVREELTLQIDRLSTLAAGRDSFAVRSSAVGEDSPNASFAGQLQTCLNVPASQVPSAVVSVWKSADAAGVATYRGRLGQREGAMAVLVQPLVLCDVSGVVFTADPVTGSPDRLVINAAWGLGEGVVGGLMTPDHWDVDRGSGRVLQERIGEKSRMVVPGAVGETEVVTTPADRAAIPCLDPSKVAELAELCLKVEAHFGCPVDIEWAYDDGRFWLLQSRPITVQPQGDRASELDSQTDPETVWTTANIQEVIPGLVMPLDWSLLRERLNYALRKPFLETHTLLDPDTEFVAVFYNRAFANVSALRGVASRAIGTSPEAVDEQYLGKARDPAQRHRRPSLSQLLVYLDTTPRIIRFLYRTSRGVPKAEARLRPWLEQTHRQDLAGLTVEDLLARIHEANARCLEMGALHIATSSGASIYFESLGQLLRKWFGAEAPELEPRLVTGLTNVVSALPGLELSELAAVVGEDAELHRAVIGEDPWPRIQGLKSPSADRFRARLAQFLDHHGHRGVKEAEVAARSWDEDPNSVLVLLRNFLDVPPEARPGPPEARPGPAAARQEAQRLSATESIERRLDPARRLVFRFVLRQAQSYVSLREQTKSLWMEVTHRMRRLFREVGMRLCEQGLLGEPQDLYFLTFAEVQRLIDGGAKSLDTASLVRRRRAEYARNQQVVLPDSFQGRPEPQARRKPLIKGTPAAATGTVLQGIAVSPGVVTGPARVVLDPREGGEVKPGDILVAPVTDVGWTPMFLLVAGLVVDVGGPLSHGSIVAREYGLPAVVNVKLGTQVIRTGQTITVNGSTGQVFLE